MPPAYVKAYVKRNKNDAADAEAIGEVGRSAEPADASPRSSPAGAATHSPGERDAGASCRIRHCGGERHVAIARLAAGARRRRRDRARAGPADGAADPPADPGTHATKPQNRHPTPNPAPQQHGKPTAPNPPPECVPTGN